jgi:hypothetical protein
LFNGTGTAARLELRLVNQGATAAISKALVWVNTGQERAFGQYASGTKYRVSARGWNGTSSDNRFDGILHERIVSTDNPATC